MRHPVQEELYNIAHEALNNALKHAHANTVRIRLRFERLELKWKLAMMVWGSNPHRWNGGRVRYFWHAGACPEDRWHLADRERARAKAQKSLCGCR